MKFKKINSVLILPAFIFLSALPVFAEGGQQGGAVKIGLVTDVGGINDRSFNQNAWVGLQRFRNDKGAIISYIEARDAGDYSANINTFVDQNVDLIWGIGSIFGDDIAQAGRDYPNQKFAIVDYAYSPGEVPNNNITGVVFAAEECSFLVGYIAGKATKTNKVGYVNGISSPATESLAAGYYAGILTANPDAEIMGRYSGTLGDPEVDKNIAKQYFFAGVDIIYHAAGGTGAGVIEAAREEGKWAIGVDMDQNYMAPDNVLTSALKRVDNALYDVSESVQTGTFRGGDTLLYNLKNNGIGYATTGNHIPPAIIQEVEAVKARIISGEQKVPATAAELNAMFPGKYNLPPANQ
jgi:basic membrane protein A